jgi:predicted RNA-binding Zn ribbon-like protein
MEIVRREVLKFSGDLAVEFANTVSSPAGSSGALQSWSDLIDFLVLRGGLGPGDGAMLRAMGATDARRCAAAFAQALRLRETIRAMLGAMAGKRSLRAEWIAEVNEALAAGASPSRLLRQDGGWRLGLSPGPAGSLQALAPIARAIADLVVSGRSVEIGKCANPRCVLYFRDRSRTRRRRWCSMSVCGNRMKVAAHLRRHGRRRRPA